MLNKLSKRLMKSDTNSLVEEITQLLPQIFKIITREDQFRSKNTELTIPQLRFLRTLYTRKEVNMKELSQELQVAPPSATITADRLVSQGLIIRKEDPEDRRVVRIVLTSKGRTITHEFMEVRRKRWTEIMNSLDEKGRRDVVTTFHRLLQLLQKTEKLSS